jgi:hypothetical protein
MRSSLSFTLIVCLVKSTVSVAAQEPITAMMSHPMSAETVPTNLAATRMLSPAEDTATPVRLNGVIVTRVTNVRAELEVSRRDGAVISVELKDGSRLTGSVGALRNDRFELIQQSPNRDMVPYAQVAAFLDPATGQVLAAVQQRGIGGVGRPSVKTTLIVLGAVAAGFLYLWYRIPK